MLISYLGFLNLNLEATFREDYNDNEGLCAELSALPP